MTEMVNGLYYGIQDTNYYIDNKDSLGAFIDREEKKIMLDNQVLIMKALKKLLELKMKGE